MFLKIRYLKKKDTLHVFLLTQDYELVLIMFCKIVKNAISSIFSH